MNHNMNPHDQFSESRSRAPSHAHHRSQSKMIVIYTITVCLSCWKCTIKHFQGLLGDKKAFYMGILTYLDVFMCLWSYIQTIRIGNVPPKLQKIQAQGLQAEKYLDHTYSPTHKYCTICQNFKFPRVHHCSNCGKCQYKMDHHCVWTQTCIGYRNQKSFYLFCFYMAVGVTQFWYFTYRVISQRTKPLMQLFEPGILILWTFTAFSAFFVGIMIICLTITHTVMLMSNFRTLDGMTTRKMCPIPFCQQNYRPLNVYDRGEIANIKSFFQSWWLCWVPLARQPQNDIYPEPMAPHPGPLQLMRETNLYEHEIRYQQEMKRLPSLNFLPHFIGKKLRINGEVFMIEEGL